MPREGNVPPTYPEYKPAISYLQHKMALAVWSHPCKRWFRQVCCLSSLHLRHKFLSPVIYGAKQTLHREDHMRNIEIWWPNNWQRQQSFRHSPIMAGECFWGDLKTSTVRHVRGEWMIQYSWKATRLQSLMASGRGISTGNIETMLCLWIYFIYSVATISIISTRR